MNYTGLNLYKLNEYRGELQASIRWWGQYKDYAPTQEGVHVAQSHIALLEARLDRVCIELATRRERGEKYEVIATKR